MENTAYIALSGQSALKRQMSVVANNLANMNTTAYKSEKMLFVEHLVKSKGGNSFIPQQLTYTRDVAQYQDLAEGPIKNTGNALDAAIHGDGYFVVETPEGQRYTRNGHFRLSNDGKLVTLNNQAILSDAGTPFFFGPDDKDIHIASDGLISTKNGEIGKIRIVKFDTPQNLQKRAGGLYFTEEQPLDVTNPTILQKSLESSNVNPMSEITKMINVQRAYDSVRTFIDKEDQRQRKMMQQLTPRG
ncbi:MAG: flagellar basal-body rod protein FlgF [Pseudomonadota bacterium]|nr:flagellar basal-body rod protein FlgF [Pseudomonadota bacterium]